MARLDVGAAATAGFRLAVRKPGAVLVWGVVIFVLGVLPSVALFGSLIGPIVRMAALQETGVEPSLAEMMQLQTQMMSLQAGMMVISLVLRALLAGAVFRAVLEPESRAFAYLRLGAAELWLVLVSLVLGVLAFIVMLVAILLIAAVSAILYGVSQGAAIGAAILGGLAIFVALCCVGPRLSMAFPMSFAARQFRLFEAWSLTRGHTANLLFLFVLIVVFVILLEIVLGCLLLAMVSAGAAAASANLETLFAQPPELWMPQAAPWLILGGLVVSLIGGLLVTIGAAPLADAYRQLIASDGIALATPDTSEIEVVSAS